MTGQTTFGTAEKAARAWAEARGIKGGAGGWLRYCREGGPASGEKLFIQGWASLALTLIDNGVIDPQDGQGSSVRRIELGHGRVTIRGRAHWRRLARTYALTDQKIKLGPAGVL